MILYAFHPEAAAELEEASAFYEVRMVGLGKSFALKSNARSHIFGSSLMPDRRAAFRFAGL